MTNTGDTEFGTAYALTPMSNVSKPFSRADFIAATGVSQHIADAFEVWRDLLVRWNSRVNLVGASTIEDFWRRHALDCAQVFTVAPSPGVDTKDEQRPNVSETSWVDIGSGAGFPGIAVAIMATQPHSAARRSTRVTLIEPSQKRAAFLREVIRVTAAPARVVCAKWQEAPAQAADIVTARAFAPLPTLLEAASRFWSENTTGIFLKGRGVDEEILAAKTRCRFVLSRQNSLSDPDGAVLTVKSLTWLSLD